MEMVFSWENIEFLVQQSLKVKKQFLNKNKKSNKKNFFRKRKVGNVDIFAYLDRAFRTMLASFSGI